MSARQIQQGGDGSTQVQVGGTYRGRPLTAEQAFKGGREQALASVRRARRAEKRRSVRNAIGGGLGVFFVLIMGTIATGAAVGTFIAAAVSVYNLVMSW